MSLSTQQLLLGTGILSGNGNNLSFNGNTITPNLPTSTGYATTGSFVINWSGNNSFQYNISGNTSFTFTGCTNGQTIIVGVHNTGTGLVSWPSGTVGVPAGLSGVKWPGAVAPTGSVSGYTDVYTFIDLNNVIYGNVILGF